MLRGTQDREGDMRYQEGEGLIFSLCATHLLHDKIISVM